MVVYYSKLGREGWGIQGQDCVHKKKEVCVGGEHLCLQKARDVLRWLSVCLACIKPWIQSLAHIKLAMV